MKALSLLQIEMTMNENLSVSFLRLIEVLHELREKCPWDRVQTKESLRHLTIEETYELSEAILEDDYDEVKVELGDLLLHIVFYARLAEEKNKFSTEEMIDALIDKLIRRHPHIYGDVKADDADTVIKNWEQIKMEEKGEDPKQKKSVLSGVPAGLPAMIKAYRIQEKVRNVGFDWEEPQQVWEKVEEEMEEFHQEAEAFKSGSGSKEKMEGEFGDLLFSLINYARFLDINPEDALERTNLKFKGRFEYLESEVNKKGLNLKEMSLAEMDVIWEEAKKLQQQ